MTTESPTTIEQRVSRLEGAYEQVNERLGDLTQAVASIRAEQQSLREKIDQLRGEMHRQALLVIGVLGGLMAVLRFVG